MLPNIKLTIVKIVFVTVSITEARIGLSKINSQSSRLLVVCLVGAMVGSMILLFGKTTIPIVIFGSSFFGLSLGILVGYSLGVAHRSVTDSLNGAF
jgi:hypothetical protein